MLKTKEGGMGDPNNTEDTSEKQQDTLLPHESGGVPLLQANIPSQAPKRSRIPLLAGLAVLVAVVVGGTAIYYWHSPKAVPNNHNASTTSASTSNSSAVWKTGMLQYEKLKFKYPSRWKLSTRSLPEQIASNGTVIVPNSDRTEITSPTGLEVLLQAGISADNSSSTYTPLSVSTPVQTLGGQYYLVYYTSFPAGNPGNKAAGACLSQAASVTSGIPSIPSKNIEETDDVADPSSPSDDMLCIDATNPQPEQSVMTLQSNASYDDAIRIIESLSY